MGYRASGLQLLVLFQNYGCFIFPHFYAGIKCIIFNVVDIVLKTFNAILLNIINLVDCDSCCDRNHLLRYIILFIIENHDLIVLVFAYC